LPRELFRLKSFPWQHIPNLIDQLRQFYYNSVTLFKRTFCTGGIV